MVTGEGGRMRRGGEGVGGWGVVWSRGGWGLGVGERHKPEIDEAIHLSFSFWFFKLLNFFYLNKKFILF